MATAEQPAARQRPATEAEAKALASAVRLRILRVCLDEPLTNREIAQRLGLNPGTTLHHVRTLVDTGFLAAQPVRRGARGAREIPYLATGKSWTLNVHESKLRDSNTRAMLEAFRQEVDLVKDLRDTMIYRLGLRLTEAEYQELNHRLTALLQEYADRALDERGATGRPYSLMLVLHPDLGRQITSSADG
jgi:DNA-binding IclR family transcriptional regulator